MSLTKEQLEFRRTGIGSSDVAAIAGTRKDGRRYTNFGTPLTVYLDKIGELPERKESEEEKTRKEWGHLMEPLIADKYSRKTGKKLINLNTTVRCKKYPFMLATVDRLIDGENAALEIKDVEMVMKKEWEESFADGITIDVIPDKYLFQAAHQRIVGNGKESFDYVDVMAKIGNSIEKIIRYEKHSVLEDKIINLEDHFYHNHVLKRIPPDPLNYKEASSFWPVSQDKTIVADLDILQKVEALKEIQSHINNLLTKEEEYKSYICNLLKDAAVLLSPEGQALLTWKTHNATGFDTVAFKEKYPDLYKEFSKISTRRPFKLK